MHLLKWHMGKFKPCIIIGLLIIMASGLSINLVSAWSNNTFNNSLTNNLCYQETANDSNAIDGNCGLNYDGKYDFDSGWLHGGPLNLYDGNWNSLADGPANDGLNFTINYTKPLGSNGVLWQIKDTSDFINITIPSSCFNYYSNKISLRMRWECVGGFCHEQQKYYCYNSSGYNLIYSSPLDSVYFYEEAVIWNITSVLSENIIYNTTIFGSYDESASNYAWNTSLSFKDNNTLKYDSSIAEGRLPYSNLSAGTHYMGVYYNLSCAGNISIPIYFQSYSNSLDFGSDLYVTNIIGDSKFKYMNVVVTTNTSYPNLNIGIEPAQPCIISYDQVIDYGTNNIRYLSVPSNILLANGFLNLSGYSSYGVVKQTLNNQFEPLNPPETRNAQRLNISNRVITSLSAYFYKLGTPATGNVSFYIRNASNDAILQSKNISTASISWNAWNTATFDTPVNINGDVYLSIEYSLGGGGTNYINLGSSNLNPLPAESIWLYVSGSWIEDPVTDLTYNYTYYSYPTNTNIFIENNQIWNYNGIFNQTNNKTSNFVNSINNYLSTCSYSNGFCQVPFSFHSDTNGILQYSELIFNDIGFIENSQTYNPTTISSSIESFSLNLSYSSSSYIGISAILNYNNTNYSATTSGSGNNLIFSKSLTIPIVSEITNKSFYWIIELSNSTGVTYFITTTHNQTINPSYLILCNGTYTQVALNFTLKEEATFNKLNGSLAMTLNYWPTTGDESVYSTYSFSNQTDNNTNFAFCIYPTDMNLSITGIVQYSKIGYDPRTYYFNSANINNQTQNINLYLASTVSTDTFTFVVVDQLNQPVSNAFIYVQRWDIGTSNFYTTSILQTNSNGQAITNLRLTDAFYRQIVVLNGVTVLTTTPSLESTATTPKTLVISTTPINPYLQFSGIPYTFTYNNNTQTFQFVYIDTTGSVQTGCLNVYQLDAFNGSTQIYSSCVQSTSGTLLYQLTQNGTFVGQASFILNSNYNNVQQVVASIPVSLGIAANRQIFKTYGFVAALILIGSLGMLGIASGNIWFSGFLIIAGVIVSSLIGLMTVPIAMLSAIIGLIAIILIFATRRFG